MGIYGLQSPLGQVLLGPAPNIFHFKAAEFRVKDRVKGEQTEAVILHQSSGFAFTFGCKQPPVQTDQIPL